MYRPLSRVRQYVRDWNSNADVIKSCGKYYVAVKCYDKYAKDYVWRKITDGFLNGRELDAYFDGVADHNLIHRELGEFGEK